MSETSWRTKASKEILLKRALLLKNIRAFFDVKNIIEVETPVLSQSSTTDPHLDSLQSQFRGKPYYLNTSPEYAMKRLLASSGEPIYQICKAFRDDELGANHNPEFTLLEWYRPGYDMFQLMAEMEELMAFVSCLLCDLMPDDKYPAFEYISFQQAFERYVGINPHQVTSSECARAAGKKQLETPQGLGVSESELTDWLDWLLTELVLPEFAKDGFTFLYNYPISQCSLAKIVENEEKVLVAERFEMFFGEIELANGFHELTDPMEQLQRFQLENKRRELLGKEIACIDYNFIDALKYGLPECSGVAMGLDRLLMVLSGAKDIKQVLSFSWRNA